MLGLDEMIKLANSIRKAQTVEIDGHDINLAKTQFVINEDDAGEFPENHFAGLDVVVSEFVPNGEVFLIPKKSIRDFLTEPFELDTSIFKINL